VNFAVSAIGRDRPGIVAAVSGVLLELGGNIDDSQMSILHGHFAVMLIVSLPDEVSGEELAQRLERVRDELGLEGLAVSGLDELSPAAAPTHVLTVYGADHPGIVHAVSSALAERGVNITDLRTKRTGDESSPVYMMVMEIAVPESVAELAEALRGVGSEAAVEVNLRELDSETL
jgi:glycine cleavage system transcriptional repressor